MILQPILKSRRTMRCAQAIVGTMLALSMLIHLYHGYYVWAVIDLFCIAVVADWLIPGDPPGRPSWVRAGIRCILTVCMAGRIYDTNQRLLHVVESMSGLLDVGRVAMEAHMDIRQTAGGLSTWWAMVEARHRPGSDPLPDDSVVLVCEDGTVRTTVTAGEVRALLTAIYGKPQDGEDDGQ